MFWVRGERGMEQGRVDEDGAGAAALVARDSAGDVRRAARRLPGRRHRLRRRTARSSRRTRHTPTSSNTRRDELVGMSVYELAADDRPCDRRAPASARGTAQAERPPVRSGPGPAGGRRSSTWPGPRSCRAATSPWSVTSATSRSASASSRSRPRCSIRSRRASTWSAWTARSGSGTGRPRRSRATRQSRRSASRPESLGLAPQGEIEVIRRRVLAAMQAPPRRGKRAAGLRSR